MLFNYEIRNWKDWGKVFQSLEAFTPLAREIFRREGLAFSQLENLTPGANAVFRGGEYVLKIFAPNQSGMDPQADFHNESAVCRALTQWRIPAPRLIAWGEVQDAYLFYYIITEYCSGQEAGPWLETASPCQRQEFVQGVKELLKRLHRPGQELIPPVDLVERAVNNARLKGLPDSLAAEMRARAREVDVTHTVLVHGDLTGENILVAPGGQPVIIDCADACLAPWWYEFAPVVFELFHCQRDLLGMLAGAEGEAFVERVLDALCLHDFGADILRDTAAREGRQPFLHLTEVRDFLLERLQSG